MILKYYSIFTFFHLFVTLNAQLSQILDLFNSNENESNEELSLDLKKVPYHPDAILSIQELIRKYGYPVETHTIRTEDNYLLTVHRIPFGVRNNTQKNRKSVLLMHGILECSADWVRMGPERSLGYLLADMGYDVWIGNARGNKYSRSHTFLDPDKNPDKFWNFSWHEIGMYDLAAIIDYMLEKTKNKKIHYVGHSQGCTTFFVLTSMRPEYNQKIENMFALAPAVILKNCRSPILKNSGHYLIDSKVILQNIAKYEFLPKIGFMENIEMWCGRNMRTLQTCEQDLYTLTGYDKAQMDPSKLPIIFRNISAGCSTKQLLHFLQSTRPDTKLFSLYDYGTDKNKQIYNSTKPPEYPLKSVTTPVALFSSYNDLFVDVKDVDKLGSILPNVTFNYRVLFKDFTHLDFLWAKDVVSLVYNEIFKQLKKND